MVRTLALHQILNNQHYDHNNQFIHVKRQGCASDERPCDVLLVSQHAWVGAGLAYLTGSLEA